MDYFIFEKQTHKFIKAGIYLALVMAILGTGIFLMQYGHLPVKGIEPLMTASFHELFQFKKPSVFCLALSFFLILAIQLLRTLIVAIFFFLKKDWWFFIFSTIVTLLLSISIATSYLN